MADASKDPSEGAMATSEFIRHRNALLVVAHLSDLFLDYYLHLGDRNITVAPAHDRLLKQLLAIAVLHCTSRPRNEIMAWSMNLQDPSCNLFASGDNEDSTVVGRVFTENVKRGPENLFFLETVQNRGPSRRSVTSFQGSDLFAAGEAFYAQSEQREARLFNLGNETVAMLVEHPDCDMGWLRGVTVEDIRRIHDVETVVGMEHRRYRWRCGCSEQRIFKILLPGMKEDPDELFAGGDTLTLDCPRCGAHYRITLEAFEAYVAEHGD